MHECHEFIADVDSPYKLRYVHMVDDSVVYEPNFRLIINADED